MGPAWSSEQHHTPEKTEEKEQLVQWEEARGVCKEPRREGVVLGLKDAEQLKKVRIGVVT